MIIEYGWLSLTPTPFPVVPALTKALNIRGYWLTETVYNPETFARARNTSTTVSKAVTFDPELPKPSASRMSSKRTNTWNQTSRSERSC